MDRERFTALWIRSLDAGEANDADEVFAKVLAQYREPIGVITHRNTSFTV